MYYGFCSIAEIFFYRSPNR